MTHDTEEPKYKKEHLDEYIKCKNDPIYFIKNYFHIQHPTRGSIKLELYPYQEDLIRWYEDNCFTIVKPARQVGTTAVSTAYILWFNMFQHDKTTFIIADKTTNARELLYRMRFAYDTFPKWLQILAGVVVNNKSNICFDNGSRIMVAVASACSVRGYSVSLLYIDSLAFIKQTIQYDFWTSIYPTLIAGQSKCIISSTPNENDDLFAEMWRGAIEGKNKMFPVHIEWTAPPGRDEDFKQDMINCIGERRWRQEYECEFLVE